MTPSSPNTTPQPQLVSLALQSLPQPDWADVVVVTLPGGVPEDPAVWARAVFDVRSVRWVGALFWLRERMVSLVDIPPAQPDVFAVDAVTGQEALISADDVHLDFRCGVGVDPHAGLLRVTTAVRLHGWRGRLYFAPVALLHGSVTRAMCRGAVRRLTGDR